MFSTLLGPLPPPPDGHDAPLDDVAALEATGLELVTDGRGRGEPARTSPRPRRALACRGGRERRRRSSRPSRGPVVGGPGHGRQRRRDRRASPSDDPRPRRRRLFVRRDRRSPMPKSIAVDPAAALAFADAHRRLVDGTEGVHCSLALTGGNLDGAGPATFFDLAYASYAFDLIAGPDNWRLIAQAPADRGIVCGAIGLAPDRRRDPRGPRLGGPLRGVDRWSRSRPGRPRERPGAARRARARPRRGAPPARARRRGDADRVRRVGGGAGRACSTRGRSTRARPRSGGSRHSAAARAGLDGDGRRPRAGSGRAGPPRGRSRSAFFYRIIRLARALRPVGGRQRPPRPERDRRDPVDRASDGTAATDAPDAARHDGAWYVGHPNGTAAWIRNAEAAGLGRRRPAGRAWPAATRSSGCRDGPERDAVIRATATQQPFPRQPPLPRGAATHRRGGRLPSPRPDRRSASVAARRTSRRARARRRAPSHPLKEPDDLPVLARLRRHAHRRRIEGRHPLGRRASGSRTSTAIACSMRPRRSGSATSATAGGRSRTRSPTSSPGSRRTRRSGRTRRRRRSPSPTGWPPSPRSRTRSSSSARAARTPSTRPPSSSAATGTSSAGPRSGSSSRASSATTGCTAGARRSSGSGR